MPAAVPPIAHSLVTCRNVTGSPPSRADVLFSAPLAGRISAIMPSQKRVRLYAATPPAYRVIDMLTESLRRAIFATLSARRPRLAQFLIAWRRRVDESFAGSYY